MADKEQDLIQGTGARTLVSSGSEDVEETSPCEEALENCQAASLVLVKENEALEIENEALTDIANGTPSGCSSATYSYMPQSIGIRYSSTVCFSGVSGALSGTWNGTWTSPTGNGGGSGGIGLNVFFIDADYNNIGNTNLQMQVQSIVWTNNNAETFTFSVSDTSTKLIPAAAIGVMWTGGLPTTSRIAYTFF